MPMLEHVMTDLGMEPTVREIAGYAAMRAKQAILAPTERRDDDNHPEKRADRSGRSRESGETETGFADRVDYVSEHGLRSMGMIALIDQEYCRHLVRRSPTSCSMPDLRHGRWQWPELRTGRCQTLPNCSGWSSV
jgi:hypothetical protein